MIFMQYATMLCFLVNVPLSPADSGVSDLDSSNSSDETKKKHSLLKFNGRAIPQSKHASYLLINVINR